MDNSHATLDADAQFRGRVAIWIVIGSAVGLVVLSFVIILMAFTRTPTGQNPIDSVQLVFNALLPLLGTWVGTVLAYYFARDNFESAARNTLNLVREVSPLDQLRQVSVRTAMLPRAEIKAISLAGKTPTDVTVKEALTMLQDPNVTRLLLLKEKDVVAYVIHQAMLYKFVAEQNSTGDSSPPFDPAKATLAQFFAAASGHRAWKTMGELCEKAIGFVPADANMADAKLAMENIEGCQDVFVTETGRRDSPVLGWLMNNDIARHLKT